MIKSNFIHSSKSINVMKNHLLKIAALCCVAFVLAACDKDKTTETKTDVIVGQDNDPIEQLRSFRRQIEEVKAHPGAKSTETMSLADALWDVENTFNLTYTDAEHYYSQITDHDFTLYLPVDENQQVTVYDAVGLYSEMVEQARTAVTNRSGEREFITLNITETEVDNGMVRVDFSGKVGERTNYNPPQCHLEGPFGPDDNWMFAAPLGKCDDPDIPSGADEQLQEKLFDALIGALPEASPGYRDIFVNRVVFQFDGTTYPGIYYSNDLDHLCIPDGYMNDHYQAELRIISQTIPELYHLTGYSPLSIEIKGTEVEGQSAVTHQNTVYYGIRLQVSTDEFGEVIAL